MREFDAERRNTFFDQVFAPVQARDVREEREAWLHPRDRILLERLLPGRKDLGRVLDFGCGQGRLLSELGNLGLSVVGIEPSDGMRAEAEANCRDNPKISLVAGGIEALESVEDNSVDLFIAMGVFQYLGDEETAVLMAAIERVLAPGGTVIATFQNALFDLFTFNKYTHDFLMNDLLAPHANGPEKDAVAAALAGLMTRADAPPYGEARARDNIFVRLTNPLTQTQDLRSQGWSVNGRYFYEYFGLPPLVKNAAPETFARIAESFEVVNAEAWQGHFMANAFLVELERCG
jgi:SAM-dependent methyltransferase